MNPRRPSSRRSLHLGFTLVELAVVVLIIGLLAMLVLPAFTRIHRRTVTSRFTNDLRIICSAVEVYALEKGMPPPDGMAGLPPELLPYVQAKLADLRTPIGGVWDWDVDQFGVKAGLSVFNPEVDDRQLADIDARLDDGNLSTGSFRKRPSGVIYVTEP